MNQSRKEMFVANVARQNGYDNVATRVFSAVSSIETEENMDIAEMSHSKVDKVINEIAGDILDLYDGSLVGAQIGVASVLYNYNLWCNKAGFQFDNSISRSKYYKVAKASEWVIKSPIELQSLMDAVFMPETSRPTDLFIRGVVWLAYAGLGIEEIPDVQIDDFDGDSMTVSVNRAEGRVRVKVPDDSRLSLLLLSRIETFYEYDVNLIEPKPVARREGRELVRAQVRNRERSGWDSQNKRSFVRNAISRLNNRINKQVTYDTLVKNGYYYRAYLEELKLPAEKRLGGNEYSPGVNMQMNYRVYNEQLEYYVDYRMSTSRKSNDEKRSRQVWRQKIYNEYLLWRYYKSF